MDVTPGVDCITLAVWLLSAAWSLAVWVLLEWLF
jgi:hypothetical protein